MAGPVLQVHNLTVAADSRTLLERLSFAVECGQLVGLSGPSGCGKTTLLRAIAGLIDATEGSITLRPSASGDQAWVIAADSEPPHWPTYRRHIVLVQQRSVMCDDETVRENLRLPLRFRSHLKDNPLVSTDWDSRARSLLRLFRLQDRMLSATAGTLSVGEQQRISLIRAILIQPEVLLLDEPTSALDAESAAAVEAAISQLAQENGLAAVIVSHDTAQLDRWCSHRVDLRPFLAAHEEEADAAASTTSPTAGGAA